MSNVTFNEFAQRFADEIEIDLGAALNESLSEIREFDSMAKINISLLIEELFGFQIDYEDLDSADSLKVLYNICEKNGK